MNRDEIKRLTRAIAKFKNTPSGPRGEPPSMPPTAEIVVPNVIDFVLDSEYLARPVLYPRQGTLLKTIFLQPELYTDFDRAMIAEWSSGFSRGVGSIYEGKQGIVPDVMERMSLCIEAGRRWFREVVMVAGRRAGKGWIGAVGGAYILLNFLALGDPQRRFGIDPDKHISALVVGAKRDQVLRDQWNDLTDLIRRAKCFAPFVDRVPREGLTLHAPADLERRWRKPNGDWEIPSSFEISPLEFSSRAGRGPTACMLLFDEMAHVDAGLASSADAVYSGAVPSLDQFRGWEWIYLASSPWSQAGRFYAEYLRALEVDEQGAPAYPDIMTLQIASWDMFKDWERTGPDGDLVLYPGGPPFPRIDEPVIVLDQAMERERRADPVSFAVEREAQWSSGSAPYLLPHVVDEIFGPWEEHLLEHQSQGSLGRTYFAHGDPAKNRCNFSFVIAHLEGTQEEPHVVIDLIIVWRPQDFDGYAIDYLLVESEIQGLIRKFGPAQVTFDQYNFSGSINTLNRFAARAGLPRRAQIFERTATAELNQRTAETFRNMANLGRIHAPPHQLAIDELKALQYDGKKVIAPTSGQLQTKDVADAIMIVSYELLKLAGDGFITQQLSELQMRGSQPGGFPTLPPDHPVAQAFTEFSRRRRRRRGG